MWFTVLGVFIAQFVRNRREDRALGAAFAFMFCYKRLSALIGEPLLLFRREVGTVACEAAALFRLFQRPQGDRETSTSGRRVRCGSWAEPVVELGVKRNVGHCVSREGWVASQDGHAITSRQDTFMKPLRSFRSASS